MSEHPWIKGGPYSGPEHTGMPIPDDPIVGHKTHRDGHHEPLRQSEAVAIMAASDEAKARRAEQMPDEQSAIRAMFEAWLRLKELGWNDAIYCPKDGTWFDAIEAGSTGIHDCHYEGDWPTGTWWIADGDLWPSRPVLFRRREKPASADAVDPHATSTGKLTPRDELSSSCSRCTDLQIALEASHREREEETRLRIAEVEHWVTRYNELEAWRIQTARLKAAAEARAEQAEAALASLGQTGQDTLDKLDATQEKLAEAEATVQFWEARHHTIEALLNERDTLRAALAASEGQRWQGWQPIETAPKDGDLVLLYPSRCWSEDVNSDCEVGYWDEDLKTWWALGAVTEDYTGPTHWMPLPAAPDAALARPAAPHPPTCIACARGDHQQCLGGRCECIHAPGAAAPSEEPR